MSRAPNFRDLTGLVFGLLTVDSFAGIKIVGKAKKRFSLWKCNCACGSVKIIKGNKLVTGYTKSCGCATNALVAKARTRHGENRRGSITSPEYRAWAAMKRRCENPNQKTWDNYGGRGIRVCSQWSDSFEKFLEDVGRKPSSKHSLDRFPDNDGNYEPGNVRWATAREQRLNQRRSS